MSIPELCPECGSAEASLPSHSDPYFTCADCGASWGGWLDNPDPRERMVFFLGTPAPDWLARVSHPLFVSRRRLARLRRTLPRARGPWALDSGGFTDVSQHGRWSITPAQYAAEATRWASEVGGLRWAAIMDWMCEPFVLAKTGLTVAEHQRRTIASYAELVAMAPTVPWVPVLQGWRPADYFAHVEQYAAAGIDLSRAPLVGIGSVCRRQSTAPVEDMIRTLSSWGLRLHGFGFKLTGLRRVSVYLASSDSMAWSYNARRNAPLPGCTHRRCQNCLRRALWWRRKATQGAAGGIRLLPAIPGGIIHLPGRVSPASLPPWTRHRPSRMGEGRTESRTGVEPGRASQPREDRSNVTRRANARHPRCQGQALGGP